MRPKTPAQVCDRLISKGWNTSIAFYEGAKYCRNLNASLIRDSLQSLRGHPSAGKDVRALVEAVRAEAQDEVVQASWRAAIDALRALYHTSPIGTQRERDKLITIARDKALVMAMVAAASTEQKIDPSWLAVFSAEGSPEALALVERQFAEYAGRYQKLIDAVTSFKHALLSTELRAADDAHSGSLPLPIQLCGGTLTRAQFWALVDSASTATDPAGTLSEWLNELEPKHIAAFDRHFDAAMDRAYQFDLWGAAYLLLGGRSDDCFSDFRADLILRGKKVFELVLKSPDALADHADVEGDETIASLAAEIYQEKTERTLPPSTRTSRRVPAGRTFNFDDKEEMRRRYPRLFELRAAMRES
jgi:hypothetical protein